MECAARMIILTVFQILIAYRHLMLCLVFGIPSEEEMMSNIKKSITERAGNEAIVDWDGFPVYYHNINSRNSSELGSFVGNGMISSFGEELLYRINSKQHSAGQQSAIIFNKLLRLFMTTDIMNVDKTIETVENKMKNANKVWQLMYNSMLEYFKKIYNPNAEYKKMTALFDEIDKSLDITNVIMLYETVLPTLATKCPIQIIAVSHSPVILTNNIFENPLYNIISLDEEYTKECRELLTKYSFH